MMLSLVNGGASAHLNLHFEKKEKIAFARASLPSPGEWTTDMLRWRHRAIKKKKVVTAAEMMHST